MVWDLVLGIGIILMAIISWLLGFYSDRLLRQLREAPDYTLYVPKGRDDA